MYALTYQIATQYKNLRPKHKLFLYSVALTGHQPGHAAMYVPCPDKNNDEYVTRLNEISKFSGLSVDECHKLYFKFMKNNIFYPVYLCKKCEERWGEKHIHYFGLYREPQCC